MTDVTGGTPATPDATAPRRLEVWAEHQPQDSALIVTDDTVRLILRDGMLPRATVFELGILLSGILVTSAGARVDELPGSSS